MGRAHEVKLLMDNKGFDLPSAQNSARLGEIENWVHRYLLSGYWANDEFSKGLKRCRRWWAGPCKLKTNSLLRKVGPEAGMEYPVSPKLWKQQIERMTKGMKELESIPPLIVEYVGGDLVVCDGNTRLGAMELLEWEYCWVIIWYNSEAEYVTHKSILKNPGSS